MAYGFSQFLDRFTTLDCRIRQFHFSGYPSPVVAEEEILDPWVIFNKLSSKSNGLLIAFNLLLEFHVLSKFLPSSHFSMIESCLKF